jgi:hypothetical protein
MGCRSGVYPKCVGVHQDLRHPSGDPGGDHPRCVQGICIEGKEADETVAGAIPEHPVL